jgi:hypothetical protein
MHTCMHVTTIHTCVCANEYIQTRMHKYKTAACMHILTAHSTDPEKQFSLLMAHIQTIRTKVQWMRSRITIYVEHNLGFEVRTMAPSFHLLGFIHSSYSHKQGIVLHTHKQALKADRRRDFVHSFKQTLRHAHTHTHTRTIHIHTRTHPAEKRKQPTLR